MKNPDIAKKYPETQTTAKNPDLVEERSCGNTCQLNCNRQSTCFLLRSAWGWSLTAEAVATSDVESCRRNSQRHCTGSTSSELSFDSTRSASHGIDFDVPCAATQEITFNWAVETWWQWRCWLASWNMVWFSMSFQDLFPAFSSPPLISTTFHDCLNIHQTSQIFV